MKIIKKILHIIASIPHDKFLHLTFGIVISQIVSGVYSLIFHPSYGGAIIGFIGAFIVGIIKEVYDYNHRDTETPEIMDIEYTTIGGLIGSLLTLFYIV